MANRKATSSSMLLLEDTEQGEPFAGTTHEPTLSGQLIILFVFPLSFLLFSGTG